MICFLRINCSTNIGTTAIREAIISLKFPLLIIQRLEHESKKSISAEAERGLEAELGRGLLEV